MPELHDIEEVPYRSLDECHVLSLEALEEVYALVPTQRQQYYREVLERDAGKVVAVIDPE